LGDVAGKAERTDAGFTRLTNDFSMDMRRNCDPFHPTTSFAFKSPCFLILTGQSQDQIAPMIGFYFQLLAFW
jgi:hypothetical protein